MQSKLVQGIMIPISIIGVDAVSQSDKAKEWVTKLINCRLMRESDDFISTMMCPQNIV